MRKIIQLACAPTGLFGLCDDGTVWVLIADHGWSECQMSRKILSRSESTRSGGESEKTVQNTPQLTRTVIRPPGQLPR
jgi:hypothetical protein